MKSCPYCAEGIADDARKCRFCGEWLGRPEMHELVNWLQTLQARRNGRIALWTFVLGMAFVAAAVKALAVAIAVALLLVSTVAFIVDWAERGHSDEGQS